MNNNVLIGATEVVAQYDGSGVFNPTGGAPETAREVPAESRLPETTENNSGDSSGDESGDTSTNNSALLMYGGLALIAYFFFFKKK
jgi:LPXTG-motif cell wall-anchored protein